jgi:hypothetical protein
MSLLNGNLGKDLESRKERKGTKKERNNLR